MKKLLRAYILILIFAGYSIAKAQKHILNAGVGIHAHITIPDSISSELTVDIYKNKETIKIFFFNTRKIKRRKLTDDDRYNIEQGAHYIKEFGKNKAFKQYRVSSSDSLFLNIKDSYSNVVTSDALMSYSKLIDSIGSAKKEILEKVNDKSRWAFFDRPQIEYKILSSSGTKTIFMKYPGSISQSLLFNLLTTAFVMNGNIKNQKNK